MEAQPGSLDAPALLAWFEPRRTLYPWRDARPDPYRVLVSEVMLQQTQAARVAPAFRRFVKAFPNVQALADAPIADVVRSWAGLGYNRRAVALSAAARAIVRDHRGQVPADPQALRLLPGVGPYTAAAVAALAYGRPVVALDTNVRRVVGRAALGADPEEVSGDAVAAAAARWIDRGDPGRWNQAVMDLGRAICRPVPRCPVCPLARTCRYRTNGRRPGRRAGRPQSRFDGSMRQLRGRLVRELTLVASGSLAFLSKRTGHPIDRVTGAARALERDGLIRAGPAALAGRPRGRIRLAR